MILFVGCRNKVQTDENYRPVEKKPVYKVNEGPVVLIDESHNNYHTKGEFYSPFAKLLSADG